MTSQPTPPRLHKAKVAATAAAVVATTAALTAGVASSAPEALAAHNRSVQADVELTAAIEVPDVVGIYGVGPVFWAAQILGLTPDNVIKAAAGALGGTEVATAVTALLETLDAISPVDTGIKGPLPGDVYDAVNGLKYTTTGFAEMLGLDKIPIINDLVDQLVGVAPILNQRRAIIFSESLGGLTTSMAYRDMIEAVTSDSADWEIGVTGQWLVFVNNPSRPGGGLFALATPFTDMFGYNFTTPDAGSYTNPSKTKVLNTSILDVTWAYNPLSDVPSTLNPLAWANSVAAGAFLTYLIPDEDDKNNIGEHVLPLLLKGILDGGKVMLDPTGGQGITMLPGWNQLVSGLKNWGLGGLANGLENAANATKFPGTATYITYDSGNLPLLEPFRMAPHLLNLVPGVDIPTPLTDSVEDALRMMVNMGYQDVDPDTLERNFDKAGEQAYLWHSPLTPTQQLAANEMIFDALIDGIQEHALDPEAWTPKLPGTDFKPVVQNAAAVALAKAMSDALETLQKGADPVFDAVEKGLEPVTKVLDDVNKQMESAIDNMMKVNGSTANKQSTPQAITSTSSSGNQLRTLSVEAPTAGTDATDVDKPDTDAKPAPAKKLLKDLGVDQDSLKNARAKAKARHAADANDPVKKSVKETVAKVRGAVDDATKDVKQPKKVKKAKAAQKEKSAKAAA
ncbi:PE-PPE domain-containing protein [Mycobacterium sp. E802]|uniref:PE-PPE domain-containing protein n=1 Tax=Mycobacterium sp. E802 TaxID=1834152 RepID=UPI0007FC4555|nr:PE-PPE domain-containing protein [Mycobacterium sp. E802]OBG84170.1 PE-PPE domain-containing protein [Mycobacterium sp. E802]